MESCNIQITLGELEKMAKKGRSSTLFFLLQKGAGKVITKESEILLDAFESGCNLQTLRFLRECGVNTFGNSQVEIYSGTFPFSEEGIKAQSACCVAQYSKSLSW